VGDRANLRLVDAAPPPGVGLRSPPVAGGRGTVRAVGGDSREPSVVVCSATPCRPGQALRLQFVRRPGPPASWLGPHMPLARAV
jgi:hypothetical protein